MVVIAKGDKVKEAETAGADLAGSDDLIEKISKGWTEFDVAIATPDIMARSENWERFLGKKALCRIQRPGPLHLKWEKR